MVFQYLEEFVKQYADSLPPGTEHVKNELGDHFRQGLIEILKKMDLITRQEFDVQTQVLAKAEEKLDKLEKMLIEFTKTSLNIN